MNSSEQKLPKLTKLPQHEERLGMSLFQEYSGNLTYSAVHNIVLRIPNPEVQTFTKFFL